MKKAALLFGILSISLLISCDPQRADTTYNGPDTETVTPFAKLSEITERTFVDDDTITNVTSFSYDNNGLLVGTENGASSNDISYSGTKKVTKVETYEGSGHTTYQFNYSGDQLLNVTGYGAENGKVVYHYADDKLASKDYFGLQNNAFVKNKTVAFTYSGDNVLTEDVANYTATDTINVRNTYTFDDKKHPLSFLNGYLKMFQGFESLAPWNANNQLKSSSIDPDDDTAEPVEYTYTVTADSDGYPTSIAQVDVDGHKVKEWLFKYVGTPTP